jgi:predicted PurR-regulated permease PerM
MFDPIKKIYKNEEAFRATIVFFLALTLICTIFAKLSLVIWPFAVSMILSSTLNVGVNKLQRIGIPRSLGTALLIVVLLGGLAFVIGVISFLVHKHLLYYSKHINSTVKFLADWIPQKLAEIRAFTHLPLEINADKIREFLAANLGGMAEAFGRYALSLYDGAKSVMSMFSFLFLVPIITFYITRDWHKCIAKIREYTPERILAFADFALPNAKESLKNQIAGQFKVSLIVMPLYGVGLWAIGLNPFISLAVMSGFCTFIPFIGIFIAFLVAFVLALAQGLQLVYIIMIAALYFVGSSIESNFLTPHFVGGRIGLHPVWIFFAVLAMYTCVGMAGALFVMPVATLIWSLIHSGLIWLKGDGSSRGGTERTAPS